MPFTEEERKERARQRARAWRQANPERVRETRRKWRDAHPEEYRERTRRDYEKRRAAGKAQEAGRRWREAHPDYRHLRYMASREEDIARATAWQKAHPERALEIARDFSRRKKRRDPAGESERFQRMKRARLHGMQPEDWAALWDAQDGRCYLCGCDLAAIRPSQVHVEHDHRCCPKETSCAFCRRGLACSKCNYIIGLANDDPALLRQIADNLEAALASVTARLAAKPVQASLLDEEAG